MKSHTLRLCASILTLILLGCGGPAPSATPQPTRIPTATVFPTPALDPILEQLNGVPARITSAEISQVRHPVYADMPEPDYYTGVQYLQGTEFGGRMAIFVYTDESDLDAAWPIVLGLIQTPKEVQDIGDLAAVNFSDIVFIRCTTLVHIKLVGTETEELLIFAQQLDARLNSAVCAPG
jgi:hypothetical protein